MEAQKHATFVKQFLDHQKLNDHHLPKEQILPNATKAEDISLTHPLIRLLEGKPRRKKFVFTWFAQT